jgi:cobalt/nickel transport system ATP-binding protein
MLIVENVSHSYADGDRVLRGVSFRIDPGEKVVLLGTNGSGKSTLLKILNGLIPPAAGRVTYADVPLTPANLKDPLFHRRFRREVALLFQNPDTMLFNPTVYDELAFGPRQLGLDDIDGRVRHWAGTFAITPHLARPPFQLSYGEKQKVCLASLLALEPRLLLLDEPTANLDPRSTGWLIDFLHDLAVTALVTTHNLTMASELGDRTLLLSENHKLTYDGDIHALMKDRDALLQANLLHEHTHAHGPLEHRHYHTHEWD